jgi:polyphosphate kinase
MTAPADDLAETAVRFSEAAAAAVPHAQIEPALMSSPKRFFNREVSWLNFNERVLEEAENPRHPLLERLRFLSISGNNLDEFYMVRVAGLKGQVREGVRVVSQDGLNPTEQLERVNAGAAQLVGAQQRQWRKLRAELASVGLRVIDPAEATQADRKWLQGVFLSQLFPILTPLAIDPAHPFPFIPNLAFCMALKLKRVADGKSFYALTPVPTQVARFWELPQPRSRRPRA